jgi:hypothetical protein
MLYFGGEDPHTDDITWWLPNFQCVRSYLRKLGFTEVAEIGCSAMTNEQTAGVVKRTVVHATRG